MNSMDPDPPTSHEGVSSGREAESLMRSVLNDFASTLGPSHPSTLVCASNLASLLHSRGKGDEASSVITDRLSPAVKFGEEGVKEVCRSCLDLLAEEKGPERSLAKLASWLNDTYGSTLLLRKGEALS